MLRWVSLAAGLALIYGLTDEFHQTFVPGRAASLKDILVDGIGAGVAALALYYLLALRERLTRRARSHSERAPATPE